MSERNNNETRRPAWKKPERENTSSSHLRPLEVEVRGNDIDEAIKVLRHKIAKDGILAALKNKRNFEKKSDERRRKSREAQKKLRRSRGKKSRMKTEMKRDR